MAKIGKHRMAVAGWAPRSAAVALLLLAGCRSGGSPPAPLPSSPPPPPPSTASAVRPVSHIEPLPPPTDAQLAASRRGDPPARPELLPQPVTVAQPVGQSALGLSDLEGIALQNNPSLAVAAGALEAARGRWRQAGLYPNPVVGYHATEVGNFGTAGAQGGFVSQRLVTAGKRRLDQEIACWEIQEQQYLLAAQRRRVLSDVRIRFYEALVAQRRVDLTQRLARIGDELVEASRQLLRGGRVAENDLLQAEIQAEEARILLDNARNENVEAWRRLAAVIGVPTLQTAPLLGDPGADLPQYRWEGVYATTLQQSPQLDAARTRIERADAAVARARRQRLPDIDTWVSVRHHDFTGYEVANVQVGVPVPIFNANQGNIQQARAQRNAARSDARRIELDLQDRLAVAFREYQNARQQAERYRDRILSRAQKSLDMVRGAYDAGRAGYLTLITSQRTFIQTNLAYLDALRQLRRSAALLEGQLLSGSLRRQPDSAPPGRQASAAASVGSRNWAALADRPAK